MITNEKREEENIIERNRFSLLCDQIVVVIAQAYSALTFLSTHMKQYVCTHNR